MKEKAPQDNIVKPDDVTHRLRILEEKFAYQDKTIDDLNDVIIEQQAQLTSLEDKIRRLEAMLAAIENSPGGVVEQPPPHY